jgi:hypothetical protein
MVRDELYFLPRFFDHYRKLGVTEFVVYDDRSIDGTRDYLVSQPDCTVITGPYAFDSDFGVTPLGLPKKFFDYAKEYFPDFFFNGRWALTVDADEFLYLPSKFDDLPSFIRFLESDDKLYATGPMVDLYPERLSAILNSGSDDFFSLAPYFDRGPLYQRIPQFPYARKGLVGIRGRLMKMLMERRPALVAGINPPIPQLFKVPLLKHGKGVKRIGCHYIDLPPAGPDLVALAHFKFYPETKKKIDLAIRERQHWGASVEYQWLNAIMENFPEESLLCPESRKFEGSVSLESAQIIQAD